MADTKISALPASTTPLAGTEVLPVVQSGTTKKVAVSDLTAGRTVSGLNFISGSDSATYNVVAGASTTGPGVQMYGKSAGAAPGWMVYTSGTADFVGVHAWYKNNFAGTATYLGGWYSNGDYKIDAGNLIIGTSGKGIKDSTGTTTLNFTSTGTQLAGTQQTSTGVFNNVGTAQNIAIPTGQAGYIVVTAVQGGVGASCWNVPFVNRLGTTAVSAAPTKAIVTADPISTVTASGADIVITPLAANTYISYAIYYTPCAV